MLNLIKTTEYRVRVLLSLIKKESRIVKNDKYIRNLNYFRDVMIEGYKFTKEYKIDSVVFSKDRAMQLHAFLLSYKQQVYNYGTIYILYKASNDRHIASYNDLKQQFSDEPFIFIEEKDFCLQFVDIIKKSNATTIGLYVDDMIFLRPVNYDDILSLSTLENIVSLSRGRDMTYSVVLQREIDLPTFTNIGNNLVSFSWNQFRKFSDWTCPIGVSGYFFGRDELFTMINNIRFSAPNSLEGAMSDFADLFFDRKGVCYDTISCCCVHANIVQTECVNPVLGVFSIENLLDKWESGLMIDVQQYYGKIGNEAQLQNYTFINR